MDRDQPGGPLRVAIVGLGPKGLFALERLLDHARRGGSRARMTIDVFEPHPVPAAGPVYDPAQPEYLRMNFAADRLDMWWPRTGVVPERERLSFVDWQAMRASSGERDHECRHAYPPRADVGRYLADGLARMLRHAPAAATVMLRASAVRSVQETTNGWRVLTCRGDTHEYDELLLAAGHGTAIDPLTIAPWEHAAPLVGAVFPVGQRLSQESVPAGAAVAVRGFALTFLDAALALTEGRGGRFEADGEPHRLRYLATDDDAGVVLPYSRGGRPMLAKPEPRLAAGIPELEANAQAAGARILELEDGFTVRGELLAILATAAAAGLLAGGGRRAARERSSRVIASASTWLTAACDGAPPPVALTPAEELARSVAVGSGRMAPDLPWAMGESWRSVYPALVARIGGNGLSEREWPAFRRLAAQMERVSFGPPLINAAKLLALVRAGRVDLTHVAAGRIRTAAAITSIGSAHGERQVDVVLNAVLAAPGAQYRADGPLPGLLAAGHTRVLPGRRGLDVRADGGAIGREGQPTPGLSILGRATEDAVIGNDTLSRGMHPHADRWALRVAHRAGREPVAPGVGAHSPPQRAPA